MKLNLVALIVTLFFVKSIIGAKSESEEDESKESSQSLLNDNYHTGRYVTPSANIYNTRNTRDYRQNNRRIVFPPSLRLKSNAINNYEVRINEFLDSQTKTSAAMNALVSAIAKQNNISSKILNDLLNLITKNNDLPVVESRQRRPMGKYSINN